MDDSADRTAARTAPPATARPPSCAATPTGSTRPGGLLPRDGGHARPGPAGRARRPTARRARQPGLAAHRRPGRRRRRRPAARRRRRAEPARGVALHRDRGRRRRRWSSATRAPTTASATCPPVTSGQVGAYLGTPLTGTSGQVIGALCVFGPEPRDWSDTDVATLRQLAESAVTELELSALVREYEGDRLRWGLAIDAAGIGTFDWDLVTGRLAWDDRLIAHVRLRRGDLRRRASRRSTPGCTPTTWPGSTEALQACIDTCGEFDVGVPRRPARTATTRWVHARGRALRRRPTAPPSGCSGAAYDTTGERERRRPRHPGARGDAGRLLQPRPRVALHPRQRRGRAAARPQPRGPARPGALGRLARPRSTASSRTATAPPSAPACRSPSTPTTPRRWTAGTSCAPGPAPTGCRSTSSRSPSAGGCRSRPSGRPSGWRSWPRCSAELAGTLDAPTADRAPAPARRPGAGRLLRRHRWSTRTGGRATSASWHADPAARAAARALRRRAAGGHAGRLAGGPGAGQRRGRSASRATTVARDAAARRGPRPARRAAPRDGRRAAAARPRAAPSGLLTLYFRAGSAVGDEDLATAQDVADRAGLALDNARLYSAQQQLAEGLQRSLLTEPPEPDHGEIAVRYLPAAEAARVGGDWYDAFLQPGGATMLVIGDVVGHDTEAAAAMGQLRGLLRGHRDLQRRRPGRGAARAGRLDDDAADRDPGHRRRRPVRADPGRAASAASPACAGPTPATCRRW